MTGWQPIETAPKDGTPMLLLSPNGFVGIGVMELRGYGEIQFVTEHAAWVGKRQYEERVGLWMGGCAPSEATHWMPLPDATAP